MPKSKHTISTTAGLSHALESIPGVHRALVEESAGQIYLICEPSAATAPIGAAAQAVLAREGITPGAMELQVSYLSEPQTPRRVRFEELELDRPRVGLAEARVVLEWNGEHFTGSAEGEGGAAAELRVCAQATVRALESVLGGTVGFNLVGIKAIRIFDTDLVAVLLHSDDAPDRRLIGASLVSVDTFRSAALAVLNATNRLLGNYLSTSD